MPLTFMGLGVGAVDMQAAVVLEISIAQGLQALIIKVRLAVAGRQGLCRQQQRQLRAVSTHSTRHFIGQCLTA